MCTPCNARVHIRPSATADRFEATPRSAEVYKLNVPLEHIPCCHHIFASTDASSSATLRRRVHFGCTTRALVRGCTTDFLRTCGEDAQDCSGQATTTNIALVMAMPDMGAGLACASVSGEPAKCLYLVSE